MKSTYFILSGSVRNEVGNLDLLGTRGKITGSQPGIAFLPSVQLVGESESEVAQSCPTLCDPMDCSLPGSSVHGIFQARVLEWVATSFSRRSSWHRDRIQVSCIVRRHFYRLSHQGSGHIIILPEAHFELKSDFLKYNFNLKTVKQLFFSVLGQFSCQMVNRLRLF